MKKKAIFYLTILFPVFSIIYSCKKDNETQISNRPIITGLKTKSLTSSADLSTNTFITLTYHIFPWEQYTDYYNGMKRGVIIAKQKMKSSNFPIDYHTYDEIKMIDESKPGGIGATVPAGTHHAADSTITIINIVPVSYMNSYQHSDANATAQQELLDYFNANVTAYWAGAYDGYVNFVYYGYAVN